MKRFISVLLLLMITSCAVAENKAYIFQTSEKWKILIGEEIPGGDYYLLPIQDTIPCEATLQYTVIHDYASKQHPDESRDHTQMPWLKYPEQADHFVTLSNGDLLMMFTDPKCDVLLVPKGEDATGGLHGLSYEELIARKNQINLAIWRSQEWQEVTVPQGTWKVGEDIPAGTWVVKCADMGRTNYMLRYCEIQWGESLHKSGQYVNWSGRYDTNINIYNPNHRDYETGLMTEYILTVEDGDYIIISGTYNQAVFTPYTGKPSLGFK